MLMMGVPCWLKCLFSSKSRYLERKVASPTQLVFMADLLHPDNLDSEFGNVGLCGGSKLENLEKKTWKLNQWPHI